MEIANILLVNNFRKPRQNYVFWGGMLH